MVNDVHAKNCCHWKITILSYKFLLFFSFFTTTIFHSIYSLLYRRRKISLQLQQYAFWLLWNDQITESQRINFIRIIIIWVFLMAFHERNYPCNKIEFKSIFNFFLNSCTLHCWFIFVNESKICVTGFNSQLSLNKLVFPCDERKEPTLVKIFRYRNTPSKSWTFCTRNFQFSFIIYNEKQATQGLVKDNWSFNLLPEMYS